MMSITIMMKLAAVLLVAVVAIALPVVQAQQSNPCEGLSENKCDKKSECTLFLLDDVDICFVTTGFKSIARQGEDNVAPGEFCTVGGGKVNDAGGGSYNAIGGGIDNICFGDTNTIAGGNGNFVSEDEGEDETTIGSTISGGLSNTILGPFGVITGGGAAFSSSNTISSGRKNTISGGQRHRVRGEGSIVTGGEANFISFGFEKTDDSNCVITGGGGNDASGNGSVVVGGKSNDANGDYSIAFGQKTRAIFDSSMVVGLIDRDEFCLIEGDSNCDEFVSSEQDGQFLVNARSFRFQIGNGKNNNGDISSTRITDKNIDRLIEALEEE